MLEHNWIQYLKADVLGRAVGRKGQWGRKGDIYNSFNDKDNFFLKKSHVLLACGEKYNGYKSF